MYFVVYASKGLEFEFSKRSGRIWSLRLYLAPTFYKYFVSQRSFRFDAFKGRLPKGLCGDWKLAKLIEQFKEYKAADVTNYDLARRGEALGLVVDPFLYQAKIEVPKLTVYVIFDPATKFLNSVLLAVR